MKLVIVLSLAALLTGALIPLQAAANAALSQSIGSVGYAALLLFAIGFGVVALLLLAGGAPPPALANLTAAPGYAYVGGLIVATYVLAITYLAPRLGVGNAICLIVTGQIVAAVAIDHIGLMGSALHPFDAQRAGGVALMVAGLFLARS